MDPWLWTRRPALCCPPTERGEESVSGFCWEVFSWAPLCHPPVRVPPTSLSLSLSSSRAGVSRACVLRGCARVFLRPPSQLICGSRSDAAQPERTLVQRSSPDRRLIRSTPPLSPPPRNPRLSHHSHHRKHERIRANWVWLKSRLSRRRILAKTFLAIPDAAQIAHRSIQLISLITSLYSQWLHHRASGK